MVFKSQLTLALQMEGKVQWAHAWCARGGTVSFHFGTTTSKDSRLLPLKARETKTESECPPSQQPVQTQIKTDAAPREKTEG